MDAPALDFVGVSMYLQEALELAASLLFRLSRLEATRDRWIGAQNTADAELALPHDNFSHAVFNGALSEAQVAQGELFEDIEAFLAAWARLSLLFWPEPPPWATNRDFTRERGRLLRERLGLDESSPLNDREVRNAWMHTDERFDAAWIRRTLGNRQEFVRTKAVEQAVLRSVRVIDVETLTVHLFSARGDRCSHSLPQLRHTLADLLARRTEALRRPPS